MPLENRTCKLLNEIEDETHFMIRCSYHFDFRDKMLSDKADALSFNVDNLSEKDNFKFLMSVTEYDCIIPVLRFINSAFDKH